MPLTSKFLCPICSAECKSVHFNENPERLFKRYFWFYKWKNEPKQDQIPLCNPKSTPQDGELDLQEGKEPIVQRIGFSSNTHSLSEMSNSAQIPIYQGADAKAEFDNSEIELPPYNSYVILRCINFVHTSKKRDSFFILPEGTQVDMKTISQAYSLKCEECKDSLTPRMLVLKQAQVSLIRKRMGHLEDIKNQEVVARKNKEIIKPLDKYSSMLVVVRSSL